MSLTAGTRLGSYEIVAAIGAGGMGEVYRAHDRKLDRDVAIKILPGGAASERAVRARFEREARAVAALNHPHIVTIHEIAHADGIEFIVMELVAGQPLDRLIPPGGLTVERATEYGAQIASALEAAHSAGIVHRDIKPANIMVSPAGQVKILDFGLAKLFDRTEPDAATVTAPLDTEAGAVMGTVAYMSPEQAQGQPLDARSDVFSFGAVLYEMLTGRRAFAGDTAVATLAAILAAPPPALTSVRAGIPARLARLVDDCLAKARGARPTAGEIAERLSHSLAAGRGTATFTRARLLIGAGLLGAAVGVGWLVTRTAGERSSPIAAVRGLVADGKLYDAFIRGRELQRSAAADDPEFVALWKEIVHTTNVMTEPSGAEVAIAPYGSGHDQGLWIVLGKTPLTNVALPRTALRARISMTGYTIVEDVVALGTWNPWNPSFTLVHETSNPPGMVRAEGPTRPIRMYLLPGADPTEVTLPDFWIDRFEVTNREYKAFLDARGYERREFWMHAFERAGRRVPWEEAMRTFHDATGRPGPATWQVGAYPEGQDDFPVTGVSWYEANAYLRFANKRMPTLPHWWLAGAHNAIAALLPDANFRGRGPERVGSGALHSFGTRDLAGNVKEWVANSAGGDLRYIVGGAWDEPSYMFADPDARHPFERAPNFGIRGARFDDGDRTPDTLGLAIPRPSRDYAKETPVAGAVFDAYRRFFAYDRTPVKAAVQSVRDSHREWRVETVTFPAVEPGETVIAHVFLPKQGAPPFQTLLYLPGATQYTLRSSKQEIDSPAFAHVLRSGRAVVLPIVKGAFERGTDRFTQTTSKEGTLWRDYVVAFYKDIARTLDYLETRPDVARDKIGFMGFSRGAALAPIVLALEPKRIRTAVLMAPGLWLTKQVPEVDAINFLPRVSQPVVMMSGGYDFLFPERRSQLPFFQLLGTPADRKRRVVYDAGHNLPQTEIIRESLDWLDKTLGPVR
ncbi:MAG: protein kinase [Vicinamibacterales bacterium]